MNIPKAGKHIMSESAFLVGAFHGCRTFFFRFASLFNYLIFVLSDIYSKCDYASKTARLNCIFASAVTIFPSSHFLWMHAIV